MNGHLLALCTSTQKGHLKSPLKHGVLRENHGLEGDAHAGQWHRQLSLLAETDINYMRSRGLPGLKFGSFAENMVVGGLPFGELIPGSVLQIGDTAQIRITQIGKECHSACAIRTAVGDCIMPTRGLFAEVIRGGSIHVGDSIIQVNQSGCNDLEEDIGTLSHPLSA